MDKQNRHVNITLGEKGRETTPTQVQWFVNIAPRLSYNPVEFLKALDTIGNYSK